MNLIKDQWIPVRRADNTISKIAPWEIGESENPVIDIVAPRPDFRGALYQFLIGLVQTTYAPSDDDEWEDKWNNIPSCDELRAVFETVAVAFELVNNNGPAFMQDMQLPEGSEVSSIRSLLIDAPGENSLKKNIDHFVKRDFAKGLCNDCTAMALFTLQVNAPAGGQGNRTGLRGGGPLTTLALHEKDDVMLWQNIWLNILSINEHFGEVAKDTKPEIFPWMGPTITSENDKKVYPDDVNLLQMYWWMPRRIRLESCAEGVCDICGAEGNVWTDYRAKNFGTSYSPDWLHSLSPYRIQKEKDGSTSLIATKGKQGGFSYPDWISLAFGNDQGESAASVIRSFFEHKVFKVENISHPRVWCFGYDMDNMKARCWYDQTMPMVILPENKRLFFIGYIQSMINATNDTIKILRDQVKAAWFARPKDAKGDMSFIYTTFYEETEVQFFNIAEKLRSAIEFDLKTDHLLIEWHDFIISSAELIFDRFALQNTDEVKNMKRIAEASKSLSAILRSKKTKTIEALLK